MSKAAKTKLVALCILALLLVVIVFQNTESVETKVLFVTIIMPRAVLILVTSLLGFAAGVLVAVLFSRKTRSSR